MNKIKYISETEVRRLGLLHEINRTFLHPLGLALELVVENDTISDRPGNFRIQDWREDPEGVRFDDSLISSEKIEAFANFIKERHSIRKKQVGYIQQPTK